MTPRPRLPEAQQRALKAATKVLVAAVGGGEAAGAGCRLGPSHLSEAAAMHLSDRFVPIDVVAQLEGLAEAMPVTAALAQAQGCIVVPVTPRQPGELPVLLARLGREVGDVFASAATALADGVLDEAERAALAAELGEMVAAGQAALSALVRRP